MRNRWRKSLRNSRDLRRKNDQKQCSWGAASPAWLCFLSPLLLSFFSWNLQSPRNRLLCSVASTSVLQRRKLGEEKEMSDEKRGRKRRFLFFLTFGRSPVKDQQTQWLQPFSVHKWKGDPRLFDGLSWRSNGRAFNRACRGLGFRAVCLRAFRSNWTGPRPSCTLLIGVECTVCVYHTNQLLMCKPTHATNYTMSSNGRCGFYGM